MNKNKFLKKRVEKKINIFNHSFFFNIDNLKKLEIIIRNENLNSQFYNFLIKNVIIYLNI